MVEVKQLYHSVLIPVLTGNLIVRLITSKVKLESVDSSLGLIKGTEAPRLKEISAIFLESVETINLSINLDFLASSIVYEIKGLPFKLLYSCSKHPLNQLLQELLLLLFHLYNSIFK